MYAFWVFGVSVFLLGLLKGLSGLGLQGSERCSVISEAVQTCLSLRLETLTLLGGSWVDYGDYY